MSDLDRLTPAQRRVLDDIGCGNPSPIAGERTINALLRRGLIFELPEAQMPVFGALMMRVRRFDMPIQVYMEWCDLCAAEYKEDRPDAD